MDRRLLLTLNLLIASRCHAISEFYPFSKNKRVSINSDLLAKCMAGVIEKDGHPLTLEPSPLYSNNFVKKGYQKNCVFDRSQFMDYLMINPMRVCDYETGNEPALRNWIVSQKDNSINPLILFRESLLLNSGNVFNAILTTHQLLRNEARWFSKKYYSYESDENKANAFWAKFIDIRGDLAESGHESQGDHRGSWYRLWGIMMFRLNMTEINRVETNDTNRTCARSATGFFNEVWADLKASSTAISAELVKYIGDVYGGDYKPGGDKAGKARINSAGAQAASELPSALDHRQSLDPDSPDCDSSAYLMNSL